MSEKSQNLRDALELIKMLEQVFSASAHSDAPVPWRGMELTLRQIAMNIAGISDCQRNVGYVKSGKPAIKNYDAQVEIEPEGITVQVETNDAAFSNHATILDRTHPAPVSGYKSKNFSPN